MDVLPPTRIFDANSAFRTLGENGVEAVLFVALKDYWTETLVMTQPSAETHDSGSVVGDQFSFDAQTTYNPGTQFQLPRAEFEIRLIDVDSRLVAWVGSSLNKGNAYAKTDTMLKSLASETITALVRDGFVDEKVQPPE